jgi:hypothetical protein
LRLISVRSGEAVGPRSEGWPRAHATILPIPAVAASGAVTDWTSFARVAISPAPASPTTPEVLPRNCIAARLTEANGSFVTTGARDLTDMAARDATDARVDNVVLPLTATVVPPVSVRTPRGIARLVALIADRAATALDAVCRARAASLEAERPKSTVASEPAIRTDAADAALAPRERKLRGTAV